MSIIVSIFVLGFIILIHEFGHFLVAKAFKVPVREFSLGMGPRLISKVIGNTRYSLKALPLGGSCAMIGEDIAGSGDFSQYEDVEELSDGRLSFDGVVFSKEEIEKNNFSVLKPWKKFLICLAGPGSNFLLALIFAFVIVSRVGFDIPIIASVTEGSPASMASPIVLEKGDIIKGLEIPDEKERIYSYRDLSLFMMLNNDDIIKYNYPLVVTVERGSKKEGIRTIIYPKYDDTYKKAMIGIGFENVYKKPNSFIETCKFAFNEFYFYINTTVKSLKMLIRGKVGADQISGPVGTVAVMGDMINEAKEVNLESTIMTIVMLIVLISSNLGVMNLLPIPALDGGRIVFAAIEMIIGRPIDKKIENTANAITMILLLLFMAWIFGLDIIKLMK